MLRRHRRFAKALADEDLGGLRGAISEGGGADVRVTWEGWPSVYGMRRVEREK